MSTKNDLSNSQMTGANPANLPQPTEPLSPPLEGKTTIQRVGIAVAVVFVGVCIYMAVFA